LNKSVSFKGECPEFLMLKRLFSPSISRARTEEKVLYGEKGEKGKFTTPDGESHREKEKIPPKKKLADWRNGNRDSTGGGRKKGQPFNTEGEKEREKKRRRLNLVSSGRNWGRE